MSESVRYPLKSERERGIAKATAAQVAYLLRSMNEQDVLPLCAQFSQEHGESGERCVHPDSAYGHIHAGLAAMLRMLGIPGSRTDEAVQDLVVNGFSIEETVGFYAPDSSR